MKKISTLLLLPILIACSNGKTTPDSPTPPAETASEKPVKPSTKTTQEPPTPASEKPAAESSSSANSSSRTCGNKTCKPEEECITYFGIAGPSGPTFYTCAIRCTPGKGADSCPSGMKCTYIADGPGPICYKDEVASPDPAL